MFTFGGVDLGVEATQLQVELEGLHGFFGTSALDDFVHCIDEDLGGHAIGFHLCDDWGELLGIGVYLFLDTEPSLNSVDRIANHAGRGGDRWRHEYVV